MPVKKYIINRKIRMRECEEKKDGSFKIDRSVYSESDLRNEMAECGNSEWFICDRGGCFNKDRWQHTVFHL